MKWQGFLLFLILRSLAHADDGVDTVAMQLELLAAAPKVADYTPLADPSVLWTDKDSPERDGWGPYELRAIHMVFERLDKAEDISLFCPNYSALSSDQKVIVWGQLFASVSYWESSFDPTNRWLEQIGSSAGIDSVTHKPVISEGLLQLSYQDIGDNGKDNCPFDYEGDLKLADDDVHRTILNPYSNLFCGIHIMARQIDLFHKVVISDGFYWATLQDGNFMENRVPQIQRMVSKNAPFCGEIRSNVFERVGDFLMRKFEDVIVPIIESGSENGGKTP